MLVYFLLTNTISAECDLGFHCVPSKTLRPVLVRHSSFFNGGVLSHRSLTASSEGRAEARKLMMSDFLFRRSSTGPSLHAPNNASCERQSSRTVLVTQVATCIPITFLVSGGTCILYVGSAVSHISSSIVTFRSNDFVMSTGIRMSCSWYGLE